MDLKSEIFKRVEAFPSEQQGQVLALFLACCEAFEHARPRGEHGTALLPFWGVLDDTSATEMREAIEASCESVNLREW